MRSPDGVRAIAALEAAKGALVLIAGCGLLSLGYFGYSMIANGAPVPLIEAIAAHQGLNPEGGSDQMNFSTVDRSVSDLHEHLRVAEAVAGLLGQEAPEEVAEAVVREDREPVVARRLAVLQPCRRPDGAVLLQRLVRRVCNQKIYTRVRKPLQGRDGVSLNQREPIGWCRWHEKTGRFLGVTACARPCDEK